jgi:raffinose/stachyose/melibiose transport system permease protein
MKRVQTSSPTITQRLRSSLTYLLFCLPALLVYVVFWVVPGLSNVLISLTDWSATTPVESSHFVGSANWATLVRDPLFWNALKNNAVYGVVTVSLITTFALVNAVLIERGLGFGRTIYRTILFIPLILPWVVVSLLWKWLYDPAFGMINVFLKAVGLNVLALNWLGETKIALYAIIAVVVWKNVGFHMIIFVAGLQGVPRELEEAAQIDGAGAFATFMRVILPILRPIVGIVTTVILIDAFRVFDVVFIMTEGGPGYYSTDVLSTYIYRAAFQFLQQSYGSTLSVALFAVVALMSLVSFTYSTRRID